MSVDSARQLCTMFLSLHVVFLSVAIVECSAAANTSEEGKANNAWLSSPVVFMGRLCCRNAQCFFMTWHWLFVCSCLLLHTSLVCILLSCFCFLVVVPSDCVRSSGVDYRGVQQSSSSGLSCLNWTNITRDYDLGTYPDSQTGKETSFKNKLYCSSSAQIGLLPVMENNVSSRVLAVYLQDMQQLLCNL